MKLEQAIKRDKLRSIELEDFNNNSATILLAPACSSFDQYKNFEQRGDEFINLTRKFVSAKLIWKNMF